MSEDKISATKFSLLFNLKTGEATKITDKDDATRQAKSQAERWPGTMFAVLTLDEIFMAPVMPVQSVDLVDDPDDDIPF